MSRRFTPRPGPRNLTAVAPIRQPSGHELQRRDQDEQRGLDPHDIALVREDELQARRDRLDDYTPASDLGGAA